MPCSSLRAQATTSLGSKQRGRQDARGGYQKKRHVWRRDAGLPTAHPRAVRRLAKGGHRCLNGPSKIFRLTPR
jgi:hypothetical protein